MEGVDRDNIATIRRCGVDIQTIVACRDISTALVRNTANARGAAIRAEGLQLIKPCAHIMENSTEPNFKDIVFHVIVWMYNRKAAQEDPNTPLVLNQIPLFVREYKAAREKNQPMFANNILNGLSNLLSHCGRKFCEAKMMENDLLEVVKPALLSGSVEQNSVSAALLVANLAGHREDQAKLVTKVIPQIVDVIKASLNPGERYADRTWSPKGACQALANVSLADANKEALIKARALPIVCNVIRTDWEDMNPMVWRELGAAYFMDAKGYVAKIIWNLSFQYEIQDHVADVEELLTSLIENKNVTEFAKSTAEGALFHIVAARKHAIASTAVQQTVKHWRLLGKKKSQKSVLAKKEKEKEKNSGDASGKHVMISYSWAQQDLATIIRDKLREMDFPVWIDIDQMSASTLAGMAQAVEDAAVVLIVLSEDYKESEACRTEGEYAYTLRKNIVPVKATKGYTPDGWLGALVGAKLYFEIHEDFMDDSFIPLIKELEGHRGMLNSDTTGAVSLRGGGAASAAAEAKIRRLEARIKELESNTRLKALEDKMDRLIHLVGVLTEQNKG